MPKDRMAFWVSFLPDDKRVLRPDGLHLFGLKYWHGALARDVGRTDEKILVRYDPRDISRVFVARASGRFIEARWQDLTLPPVSLHEWRNELKARNNTASRRARHARNDEGHRAKATNCRSSERYDSFGKGNRC
jgi:Mu transposase, C-terminal